MITVNKKLVIISDFDDTLANKYVFNKKNNSHKPILDKKLLALITNFKTLGIPFIIATSRGFNDPNLEIISKLSNFPLIIESGGGLFSNGNFTSLITKTQKTNLDQTKNTIELIVPVLKKFIQKKGYDLDTRLNRFSSIEFRIQDKEGVGLNSKNINLYVILESKLKSLLGKKLTTLQFKRGGSSLNIVPSSVSKTSGLKRLFKIINLNRKDCFIVGFGDSNQDSEIFSFSNLGICVGDAYVNNATKHIPEGPKAVIRTLKKLQINI